MTGPDLFVDGIALITALIARRGVAGAATGSAPAARLRTVFSLAAALMALRLLAPVLTATPLTVALMLVATWLPFAALRFAEELCRRHAARAVKLLALGGALAFSAVAITVGFVWSAAALMALALYQAVMLALMALHLWRSRPDLAPAERRTVDTILLALLLTIPLAASDFVALFPDLPVRGGAFAVLVLALATSGVVAGRHTPWRLAGDLALIVGAGGATVLAGLLGVPALDGHAAAALAAGGSAVAALVLLSGRFGSARLGQTGLIAALARVPEDSPDTFIAAHPLLEGGRMLGEEDFAAYPPESIRRLLDHPLVTADLDDPEAREAGCDLLDAVGATHLLRVSREPPRLLAVAAGALASPTLDDELAVAARLLGNRG